MCGIAGAVALSDPARPAHDRVARMSHLLVHRGPDAEGSWVSPSGRAVFAHRRLSIIDLATGGQPMLNDSGQIGLVFNGEIYNYRELRKELANRGVPFRTDSDTEVILRLYERAGTDCVHHLRGMFGFAIWDDRLERLTLARDRVGKKPVYYTTEDGCVYFSSTLSALRQTSRTRWHIDLSAMDSYMTLGYIPAPQTIYAEVSKLEAGTVVTFDRGRTVTHRYWDFAAESALPAETFVDAVDRLDEMLHTAVRLRLRSDVPLGVFLSGGVDSSLVTAVAARQSATPIATFSIGFDIAAFDESEYAAQVARRLGTEHHVFRAQPDLLHTLPDMVRHFGEPFADASALPTWMLARETRKHVTVALGGDGGDEAFAGYDWYRSAARLGRITDAVPERALTFARRSFDVMLRNAFPTSRRLGRIRRGIAMLDVRDVAPRFAALRSFVGPSEVELLYAGPLLQARCSEGSPAGTLLTTRYRRAGGSDLRRMRCVDVATYLADCLMPKVDVATMAHGLEARAPLLDHEVLRFALSLPDEWLVDRSGGKKILRAVLSRYLPLPMFERPKHGFSVPLKRWFSTSLRSAVSGLATSERLMETGLFKLSGIQSLVQEHVTERRDHSQRLFGLLVLDEWLKTQ